MKQNKKSKWADFADSMSNLTTPEITKHIEKSSQELRENFKLRDLNKNKWIDFAEKMDGLFTPDIIKHINFSRKEAKNNFE